MVANSVKKFKLNRFTVLGAIAATVTTLGLSATAVFSQNTREVKADGSSTVFPITEAVAEEFQAQNRDVRVTVGISGTGGGFKKFCNGETDIQNASRPIKAEEMAACKAKGIEYIELPVAFDALTIVVHPQNTWVNSLTVAELKKMWEPAAQGQIKTWNQIRSSFPNQPLNLYGAGTDSGTFDYFTEAIVGKAKESRADYTASEDDNVLVQGVSRDRNALGYFGLAYFEENSQRLRAVPIDDGNNNNGRGAVAPNPENVRNGTYQPLSRPLLIYVSTKSLERPEVQSFVQFYLDKDAELVDEVGYVALNDAAYSAVRSHFTQRKTGTVFANRSTVGIQIEDILRLEAQR